MDLAMLKEFFQWCLVLNLGLYLFSVVAILGLRKFTAQMHTKLFGVSEETANRVIYQYLAAFKLSIIVLNFVPWLAVLMMQ